MHCRRLLTLIVAVSTATSPLLFSRTLAFLLILLSFDLQEATDREPAWLACSVLPMSHRPLGNRESFGEVDLREAET